MIKRISATVCMVLTPFGNKKRLLPRNGGKSLVVQTQPGAFARYDELSARKMRVNYSLFASIVYIFITYLSTFFFLTRKDRRAHDKMHISLSFRGAKRRGNPHTPARKTDCHGLFHRPRNDRTHFVMRPYKISSKSPSASAGRGCPPYIVWF